MEDDGLIRKAYKKRPVGRPRGSRNLKVVETGDDNGNGKRPVGRPLGSGLTRKGKVSQVVSRECKDLLELRAKALIENILQEEIRLAFSDIRLIPGCPNLPDEIAYAVKSFKIHERVIKSIKGEDNQDLQLVSRVFEFALWEKPGALERLSRHLGLYEKDNLQKPGDQRPQINLYLEQGNVNVLAQGSQGQLPGPGEDHEGGSDV